jgi:hypothetical protein
MVADIDDNFPDEMDSNGEAGETENNLKGTSLAEKKAQEQAQKKSTCSKAN